MDHSVVGVEDDNMGQLVYSNANSAIDVSLPHILNVNNTLPGIRQITLLDASLNYQVGAAGNFGNPVGITVTYTSTNPNIPFTYNSFLGTLLTEPLRVGLIRVQAVTQPQISQPLNFLRNVGVGKYNGDSIYPLIYPNQFISNVAYVERELRIDDNIGLTYLQNGPTDRNIQLYFYTSSNVTLDRVFSNKKIVQQYLRPKTGITQQTQIISPSSKYGILLKSSNLL